MTIQALNCNTISTVAKNKNAASTAGMLIRQLVRAESIVFSLDKQLLALIRD